MEKNQDGSFICYNCNQKNYFDKTKYITSAEKNNAAKTHAVKEFSIECKSCREINSITIEY